MVQMDLVAVRVELPGNTPVVLLREQSETPRLLPIFIGQPEATAIAFAMDGIVTPRPMTHDLIIQMFEQLAVTIRQVDITGLVDGTFYAQIHVTSGDKTVEFSARPSDALALAVRVGCPIYADESVLEDAGIPEQPDMEPDSEEMVEAFREFIESVDPEDFAS